MGKVELTADPIGLGATCAEAEDMRGESEASVASWRALRLGGRSVGRWSGRCVIVRAQAKEMDFRDL